MTPQATQIAAFEKHCATYARSVVYRKMLNVKYMPYCVFIHEPAS